MGSQHVPEVLDSIISLKSVSVVEWLVLFRVSMKPVLQRWTLFARIENCKTKPNLNKLSNLKQEVVPSWDGGTFGVIPLTADQSFVCSARYAPTTYSACEVGSQGSRQELLHLHSLELSELKSIPIQKKSCFQEDSIQPAPLPHCEGEMCRESQRRVNNKESLNENSRWQMTKKISTKTLLYGDAHERNQTMCNNLRLEPTRMHSLKRNAVQHQARQQDH